MGFGLTQIINKFVPTKRTDDDLKENPFQTPYGQEIVSIEESFESRLYRQGRPIQSFSNAKALAIGTNLNSGSITPSPGCELYPLYICFSADQDVNLQIQYTTYLSQLLSNGTPTNYAGTYWEPVYLKAGTPLIRRFSGEVKIFEGGNITLLTTTTVATNVYTTLYGIEVTTNA